MGTLARGSTLTICSVSFAGGHVTAWWRGSGARLGRLKNQERHTHTCVVGGQRRGHTVQATLFDMLFYILFDSFRRYGGESHLLGGVHLLRQFTARRRAQRA